MRTHLMLAAGLIFLAAAPAAMAGPFDGEAAVAVDDLNGKRGGTATSGGLTQGNYTDQGATNTGSVSVGGAATKFSGGISPTQVTGNHGITAVMQNTGDLVNMNNATSVNVYMR